MDPHGSPTDNFRRLNLVFLLLYLQVLEVGILLGLMCKYSCEECTMMIYGGSQQQTVELEKGTILDNMASVLKCAEV